MKATSDKLYKKIRNLNESIWGGCVGKGNIDAWLDNFDADDEGELTERLHALYILARFIYFNDKQILELMKYLFRDRFKYPLIETIRKANNNTTNLNFINDEYLRELSNTRFLGVGGAGDSGSSLLYSFKHANRLENKYCVFMNEVSTLLMQYPQIKTYIFIDDIAGSGEQVRTLTERVLLSIYEHSPAINKYYFVLVATDESIDYIKRFTLFDDVRYVYNLDASFKIFGDITRYFTEGYTGIQKEFAKAMCYKYGLMLLPEYPLGFKGGQLGIGFQHNTPDNTLPIMWQETPRWKPIFKGFR
jgi:hypothetical protein